MRSQAARVVRAAQCLVRDAWTEAHHALAYRAFRPKSETGERPRTRSHSRNQDDDCADDISAEGCVFKPNVNRTKLLQLGPQSLDFSPNSIQIGLLLRAIMACKPASIRFARMGLPPHVEGDPIEGAGPGGARSTKPGQPDKSVSKTSSPKVQQTVTSGDRNTQRESRVVVSRV
jgi:hypothetical protein